MLIQKATYVLRVQQFTAWQVDKGGRKEQFSLITQNPILSMQNVHLKATYQLRVHQFTAQQVGKGGKEGTIFSLITQNPILSMHTCSFKGNLPAESAPVHSTERVKEVKEGMNFHSSLHYQLRKVWLSFSILSIIAL